MSTTTEQREKRGTRRNHVHIHVVINKSIAIPINRVPIIARRMALCGSVRSNSLSFLTHRSACRSSRLRSVRSNSARSSRSAHLRSARSSAASACSSTARFRSARYTSSGSRSSAEAAPRPSRVESMPTRRMSGTFSTPAWPLTANPTNRPGARRRPPPPPDPPPRAVPGSGPGNRRGCCRRSSTPGRPSPRHPRAAGRRRVHHALEHERGQRTRPPLIGSV